MSKALQELSAATAKAPTVPKEMTKDDKWKALKTVEADLNKQFNVTKSLVRLGDRVGIPMPSVASGIYTLDWDVIQTGGIPKGRIVEFYGPESGGKTTLALEFVAAAQRAGGIAAYVDAEHALDPSYMAKLGVNVDELLVSQPDSGEQGLETCEALVRSRAIDIAVIDSVAALVPQAEIDGDMGDSHVGLHARLMSQAMRKLCQACGSTGIPVIFINQIREKVGVMFGNPEVTTGGRALKFYSSVRLEIRRVSKSDGGEIKSGDVLIGHKMKVKGIKNKVGSPARETIVNLIYGAGVDKDADFITYAKQIGVLEGTTWIKFNGENIGQGLDKAIENLKSNEKLLAAVKAEVAKAQQAQREADAT